MGFTRQDFEVVPTAEGFNPVTLGLPPIVDTTQNPSRFSEFDIEGITNSIGEAPSLGPARASYFNDTENDFTWVADITAQKGSHTLKAGFEAYYLQFDVTRPDWPSGQFSFDPTYTQGPNPLTSSATAGSGIADLLRGVPDSANLSVNRALSASQHSWNLYVNDDWKITPRLTMNLGLRWEYQTPWDERHNQLAYWNPTGIEPVTGLPGVDFAGQPGSVTGRYDAIPNRHNFAPRLGLAYYLGHKTVVRAGYGWSFFDGNGGIGSGTKVTESLLVAARPRGTSSSRNLFSAAMIFAQATVRNPEFGIRSQALVATVRPRWEVTNGAQDEYLFRPS
jgi:hypothetical protein